MKIYTERVLHYEIKGAIRDRVLDKSQEYFVLALLKYYYPDEYNGFYKSEAPDLWGINRGIEVTTASDKGAFLASRVFSEMCHETNDEVINKSKEKIEAHSSYYVNDINGIRGLASDGYGIECEKNIIWKAVRSKSLKIQDYQKNFSVIDLAILLFDIPTSEAEDNMVDWLGQIKESEVFDKIIVICPRFILIYSTKDREHKKITISSDVKERLNIISRMTAEGLLNLDDNEWN